MAGRAAGTTREEILDAARGMLDKGGAEALSMRRLATQLGVAPTAIYWHVGSREQLVEAVVSQLLAEMARIVPRGRTPQARLRSVAEQMRAQVRAHPYLVHIARDIGHGAETSFPGQVALARELAAAGLHGRAAADALRAILYLVGGFIVVEAHPGAAESSARGLWRELDDPSLDRELATAMSRTPDLDAVFRYALDHLLHGILAPRR